MPVEAELLLPLLLISAARGEELCQARLGWEQRRLEVAPSPSSLVGSWVSVRCETRPGPGFVLRHYQWSHLRPGQVTGLLHHYADPGCSQPLYTTIFQASQAHLRPSWLLPGQSLTSHLSPLTSHLSPLISDPSDCRGC